MLYSRYLDTRGKGYVRKEDFRSLLEDALGGIIPSHDFEKLVDKIGVWEKIWIPYPRFLVMFESNTTPCKSAGPSMQRGQDDIKTDEAEVEKVNSINI